MEATAIDKDRVAADMLGLIEHLRTAAAAAKSRAAAPPHATLTVLYNEMATADEAHLQTLRTVATRYGHTPSRTEGGGVVETLGRLRDKVSEIGATPLDQVSQDLLTKDDLIHRLTAWSRTFQAVGDEESAGELAKVLADQQTHHDALQEGFSRLVESSVAAVAAAKV